MFGNILVNKDESLDLNLGFEKEANINCGSSTVQHRHESLDWASVPNEHFIIPVIHEELSRVEAILPTVPACVTAFIWFSLREMYAANF